MDDTKSKKKLTFIDLFAGCGGLSEGFLMSGKFEGLAHVEWELPMVKTLRNRLMTHWGHTEEKVNACVIHFDIQNSKELINGNWSQKTIDQYCKTNHSRTIKGGLKSVIGKKSVDLIIGGPPCQAYSMVGRAQDKNSMRNDYRNYLFESFVDVVNALRPKVFIFENVPGILSACPAGFPVTQRIYDAFKQIGYEIRKPEKLKDSQYVASDFGVPQKRKRVIIIGVSKDEGPDLEGVHRSIDSLADNTKNKSVRSVIEHLPKLIPVRQNKSQSPPKISHRQKGDKAVKFHNPRFHNCRDIKIFKEWIKRDMNGKSQKEKLAFYNKRLRKNSKLGKYRNLEWEKPSPTILSHLQKDGLLFIHPDIEQARSITVKEAALLQSFPDDYEFIGSMGYCFKMIGNAVPPKMASCIANAISTNL